MWINDLERGLIYSTILMTINLGIGFLATLVLQELLMNFTATSLAFFEIGMLLISGSCLMARQPMDEKDRYDSEGNFTKAWKMTQLGRQFLLASIILFLYLLILGLLGFYIVF